MALVCTNQVDGIPIECRNGNSFVLMRGLFFTSPGFSFADAAAAGDDDNWKQGVIDGNIFPVHGIKELEDTSGEDAIYESPGQDKKELFEGKRGFMASLDLTLDAHKVLRTYANKNLRLFWYDKNGNIYGTSEDGTTIQGFDIDYLNIPKQNLPTADTPMWSMVDLQLAEASQWDDNGAVILPSSGVAADKWRAADIDSVTKVTVTQVGTVTANVATFDVAYKSSSETGNDGEPLTDAAITGLDVTTFTNFAFTDGSASVTPTSMTESSTVSGRYEATFTAFTGGTVQILPTVESGSVNENFYKSDSTTLS